jgi:hypothetical protein
MSKTAPRWPEGGKRDVGADFIKESREKTGNGLSRQRMFHNDNMYKMTNVSWEEKICRLQNMMQIEGVGRDKNEKDRSQNIVMPCSRREDNLLEQVKHLQEMVTVWASAMGEITTHLI